MRIIGNAPTALKYLMEIYVPQKDHLRLAIEDVLSRYRPKVALSRYQVQHWCKIL